MVERQIDIGECFSYARVLGLYNPYPILPPFYIFLRPWSDLFGDSLVALRMPSAIASACTVVILGRLSSRLIDNGVARCAMLLFLLNPFDVYFSQYIRPYTAVSTLLLAGLAILLADGGRWWVRFIAAGVSLVIAFLSHYSIFTSMAPVLLLLVIFAPISARNRFLVLAGASLVFLIVFLHASAVLLPPEYSLQTLANGFVEFWELLPTRVGAGRALECVFEMFWAPYPMMGGNKFWKIVAAVLILAAAVGHFRAWTLRPEIRRLCIGSIVVILAAPLSALYMQNGLGFSPYTASYTHFVVLPLVTLFAIAWRSLATMSRPIGAIFLALVLAGDLAGLSSVYTRMARAHFPDWAAVEREVRLRAQPGAVMIAGPGGWFGLLHAWKTSHNPLPLVPYPHEHRVLRDKFPVTQVEFDSWIHRLDGVHEVWVLWDLFDYLDPERFLRRDLDRNWVESERLTIRNELPGIDAEISRYRRRVNQDSPSSTIPAHPAAPGPAPPSH